MAEQNGTGTEKTGPQIDPDQTQRLPATKGAVDRWFHQWHTRDSDKAPKPDKKGGR